MDAGATCQEWGGGEEIEFSFGRVRFERFLSTQMND